jgi:L-asparaginase
LRGTSREAPVSGTVVVVSTGGTIAMRADPGTGKLVPAVSGDELVELLAWPEAPPLELDDFAQVPSFDVHGELALGLARRAGEHAIRPEVSGVVVTHGTDTMEESVYLIDRLLTRTPPSCSPALSAAPTSRTRTVRATSATPFAWPLRRRRGERVR